MPEPSENGRGTSLLASGPRADGGFGKEAVEEFFDVLARMIARKHIRDSLDSADAGRPEGTP